MTTRLSSVPVSSGLEPQKETLACLEERAALGEIQRLQAELARLRLREQGALAYIRRKVDQLLGVIGTLPLRPEELDDETLIGIDPIGIIAEAFTQVLEHLQETSEDRTRARDELRVIFDSAGAAIVVVDGQRRLLACNSRARELFFQGLGAAVGESLTGLFCDPSGSPGECVFERILRTGYSQEREDFVFGGRHFHVTGTPVKDRGGEVSRVVLVYTDISSRRAAELALEEAEARLKTILNTVGTGILLIDAETRAIVDANEVAVAMIGRPREDLLGLPCHRFICPEELGQCPMIDQGQTLDNAERSLLTADGRRLPVLKTVTRLHHGGRELLLESFIDNSARREAEDALRESEERYRSLYSNMREGVALHELLYDPDGRPSDYVILDVNPAYERILGIPRSRAVGSKASALYGSDEPPYLEVFAEVAIAGTPVCFDALFEPLGRIFSISVICPAPGRFATIFDDITERKRAEREIHSLAYLDPLTGLPNRTLLNERLGEALAWAEREGRLVGLLFLDLDRFKPINDSLGHVTGDLLLKAVGDRLRGCVRKSDTVARLGGDEFVLVLPGIQRALDLTSVAREILERLACPFEIEGHEIYSSASIGIAIYPIDGGDAGTLLKNADMALYVAKDHCRNTYQFYSDEMNRHALERLELETSLRRALRGGEFYLEYQPQVDLAKGRVTGVEALLRWRHPEHGLIPPGRFIAVAEETGMILALGEWVLRSACEQGRVWQDLGAPPLRIAVNLSGRQFKQPGFVDLVEAILAETDLSPERLELELTESMIMDDGEESVCRLKALKAMGVHLAIDDFGTGYSSLSYLKRFPVDRVKIAQAFVRGLPSDPGDRAIVETVIAMARGLRLEAIAEGVETAGQFGFLRAHQCHLMQGYYFAPAVAAREIERLVREGLPRRPY